MSEFSGEPLAEASVLIRPDTTDFRVELQRQVTALTREGVTVPVHLAPLAATELKVLQSQFARGLTVPVSLGTAATSAQVAAVQKSLSTITAAAVAATHPLAQVAEALAAVSASTANTVKVSGDYLAVSRQLPLSLAQQADASRAAAVATNQQLLSLKTLALEETAVAESTAAATAALSAQAVASASALHPLARLAEVTAALRASTAATTKVSGDYVAVSRALTPTLAQQAAASTAAAAAENKRLLALKESRLAQVSLGQAQVALGQGARASAVGLTAETTAVRQGASALREHEREAAASARRIAQLGRGAAASGLTFLGLRGATLAASGAFLAGTAAVVAFARAIGQATSFTRQLNVLQATTGATGAELRQAGEAARALGNDLTLPGVNATDAAEAITELAKAGLSLQESIRGARGVLQLATAANIGFADAVTLAANALNSFQLAGRDAGRVADTLANAANAAQGSIVDIGVALQQAAAVGHQVGLSFEDTTVFLTALARAGLTSSDAGTSLRTALIRLVAPSKAAQKIFQDLGLTLRDTAGNLRPEFFTDLGTALQGMGAKQRDATLALIGGQDAIRALSILSRLSIRDLIGLRDQLAKQGTAAEVAAARTKGLAGAAENLKNTLANIGISIGQRVTPPLTHFVTEITGAVTAISQSQEVTGLLSQTLSTLGVAFHALGVTLTTLGPPLLVVAGGLERVTASIGVPAILAGAAAFVVLRRALLGLTLVSAVGVFGRIGVAVRTMVETVRIAVPALAAAASAFGTLRVASTLAATGFAGLLAGAGAVPLALAALTAEVVFLATRESDLDRANKNLKKSTDDLVASFDNAQSAARNLQDAISGVRTDKLVLETAQLAVVQAQADLASSRAARGTLERRQLENRLAIALDDVRLAQDRLNRAQADQATAERTNQLAQQRRTAALRQEQAQIEEVIAAEQKRRTTSGGILGEIGKVTGLAGFGLGRRTQSEQEAVEGVIASLKKLAAEERATTDANKEDIANRIEALAQLAQAIGKIPPAAINLIFNARSAQQGLRQVEAFLEASGHKGAADFLRAFQQTLTPGSLAATFAGAITATRNLIAEQSAALANDLAASFGQAIMSVTQALAGLRAQAAATVRGALGQARGFARQGTAAELAGDTQAQLAAAKREEAATKRAFAAAQRERISADSLENFRQKALTAQQKRQGIEAQIASDAASAQSKAEAARNKAQAARDKADQAFLDSLGFKQTRLQNQLIIAQGTKGLADDIRVNETIKRFLLGAVRRAKATIQDQKTLVSTLLDLKGQLNTITNTLKDLREQQRQAVNAARLAPIDADIQLAETRGDFGAAIRERKRRVIELNRQLLELGREHRRGTAAWRQLRNDIAAENAAIKDARSQQQQQRDEALSLDIELAQVTKNVPAEIKAREARLAELRKAQSAVRRGTLEWKRLRNEVAQENQAIKDLRGEVGKQAGLFQQLSFQFLQMQQGFASTILSNLLPTGAARGTVGGTTQAAAATPAAAFPSLVPTTPGGPGGVGVVGGVQAAAQVAGGPPGVSQGQMSVLIDLTRQIVRAVVALGGGRQHPEAVYQHSIGRADMAYFNY